MGLFDRHPADDYDPDRQGSWWDDRARMEDTLPRGGEDERHICGICGADVARVLWCGTCGDETDQVAA